MNVSLFFGLPSMEMGVSIDCLAYGLSPQGVGEKERERESIIVPMQAEGDSVVFFILRFFPPVLRVGVIANRRRSGVPVARVGVLQVSGTPSWRGTEVAIDNLRREKSKRTWCGGSR